MKYKCAHCGWIGEVQDAHNITGTSGLFCPKCGAGLRTDPVEYIHRPGPDGSLWGWAGEGWYFWDETWSQAHGPYQDEGTAEKALGRYIESLEALRKPSGDLYIHLREK